MEYKLDALTRTAKGEKVRSKENVPAVLYGAGKDNVSLTLSYNDFVKLYEAAGESSLIDLAVDGKNAGKILIHDLQYDPVSDLISHVDLLRVEMDKPITAMVSLLFVSEAPAVKEMGGTLVANIEEVEIKCLPKDLVHEIKVDLEVLKTFDDVVHIKDLVLPEGLEIVNHEGNDVIAKVTPALSEEEIKAMEQAETADVSKIEVAGKKKEEGTEEAKAEESK